MKCEPTKRKGRKSMNKEKKITVLIECHKINEQEPRENIERGRRIG